ncbi:MAG: TonB-dependent receptor [Phaeodactylibacter sp.]|nr:TonB-dependent receptor [Phaeodactylibacter sp.]
MKIRSIHTLVWLFLMPALAFSQIEVKGTVTDASTGEPLIGVNVLVENTSTGTVTDFDGSYSLTAPDRESVLSFSYIGYQPKEVTVGAQTTIDVTLLLQVETIEQVVVIGYGTQKKENLTGAISVVSAEDLKEANATSVAQALQGRTPGVNITSTTGRPGAAPSIRIRGVGSINNSAQPIVVIDNIISSIGALNNLNPQDIESVSVLKDAASAAIYGARSSNGVILVKTKSGQAGELRVEYNNLAGFATLPRRMDIMNAQEYRDFYAKVYEVHNATYPNDQRVLPPAYTDAVWAANGNTDTDWQGLITNDFALKQNHYLSFSGGSDKSTFMFSANYVSEEGVLITTDNTLVNLRINSEHKLLNGRVRVGENFAFTKKDGRQEAGGQWLTAVVTSPLMPVYNESAKGGFQGPDPAITGINERTNPVAELHLNERFNDENNIFGNIYAEIDILKGLTFRTVLGANFFNDRNTNWSPRYELVQRSNPTASLSETDRYVQSWQFDQILRYNTTVGNHSIGLMAGHTAEKASSNQITAAANDFRWESLQTVGGGNPEFTTSSQFKSDKTGESFFGRLNYEYAGKYLLTGTVRRDGSSRFGPNNRFGTFPSFSLGWKISEDFFRGAQYGWMDLLKLRFGYGFNGNEPDRDFLYETFISTYNEHVYTLGDPGRPVFGAAPYYNFGSPELKWESAEMINYGIDFVGFNGRVEFYAEYYIKNQNDLITNLPLQMVYGLSGDAQPPLVNLGDIRNSGFEFNLIYRNYENPFKYQISANLTTVKNTVEFLPSNRIFNSGNTNVAIVGHSIGSYFGFVDQGLLDRDDFAQDANGNLIQDEDGRFQPLVPFQTDFMAPGDIRFADLNQDGVINAADQTIIGKVIPDFTYGLTIDLRYKLFDLNILFQGVQNVDLYNRYRSRANLAAGNETSKDENKLRSVQDYWTPDNPVRDQTRLGLGDYNDNDRISTWWIEDASFLRVRNLQVGFTLPNSLMNNLRIRNLRIFIGGENLLTFTKYSGYDPEISSISPFGTVDDGAYPVPRFYQAGLSVSF